MSNPGEIKFLLKTKNPTQMKLF